MINRHHGLVFLTFFLFILRCVSLSCFLLLEQASESGRLELLRGEDFGIVAIVKALLADKVAVGQLLQGLV